MAQGDDVMKHLKEILISGEFAPGDRLPVERELAAQLSVSRSSLREAVRVLTEMRVLTSRQGDGTYMAGQAPQALLAAIEFIADLQNDATLPQFFYVRRLLEPHAAALAAPGITSRTLDELDDLLSRTETLLATPDPDPRALAELDQQFHSAINQASGNPVLAAIADGMSGTTTRVRIWRGMSGQGTASRAVAEHRAILAALHGRDADRARLRTEAHIMSVEDWFLTDQALRSNGEGHVSAAAQEAGL
jgi:GntR family transcriptional regulator, transcriptional repressor for pyruvate dehydrogenase complex